MELGGIDQDEEEGGSADIFLRRFHRHVRRDADAVSVVFRGEEFTYAGLDAASSAISGAIRSKTSGRDALVGLCVPRGFDMIACLIGIWKAGAAYLPLDPDLPQARIRQMLEEARPALILTASALTARFEGVDAPVIELDDVDGAAARSGSEGLSPPCGIDQESLAYVLYTSGSTGRPKGVEVTHGSVANVLASYKKTPGMNARDVVLALARISFDVSVLEIFLPLSCGARVVLLDESASRDPFAMAREIERQGITVVQGPPALWRSLLDIGWKGSARLRVLSGGEALSRALADRLLPLCAELWNAYGPTETTIVSTIHRVAATGGDVPIGRPISNTTLSIVDEALRPTPEGQEGELCIGGAGLARGYRGRPDLTTERFVSLGGRPRFYRTGDRVRIGPDGELHYVGRADGQVKLRGFRVELGEVEDVLAAHALVSACAVAAWPDAVGENALVAYVALRGRADDPAAEIRAHMRASLPDYMVPQRFVLMEQLPLTANAKLDKAALPNPFQRLSTDEAEPSPVGSTRRNLEAIWRSLLGPSALSEDSDFFDLGGYSLLTVRLLLEIDRRLGRSVSLSQLLSHSTLGRMAALVDGASNDPRSRHLLVIQETGSRPPLYWVDAGPLLRKALSAIGGDTPVFGLNLAPEDERALIEGGFDVPRLASTVVALLEAVVDRDRPFCLGGWCRWGIVAYEAARQLEERDYRVDVVVLLDTDLAARAPPWRGWRSRLQGWIHAASSASRGTPRIAPREATFSDRVGSSAAQYRAGAYRGAVALIQPMEKPDAVRATRAWRAVARGRLTIHRSPGDHVTMVRDPYCDALGHVIAASLAQPKECMDVSRLKTPQQGA